MATALKTISTTALTALLDAHDSDPDKVLDLSGYQLNNSDFSHRNLDNVNFTGSELRDVNLMGATVGKGTILKDANVYAYDFDGRVDLSPVLAENMPDSPALVSKRADKILANADDLVNNPKTGLVKRLSDAQAAAGQKPFKDGDDAIALSTTYLTNATTTAARAHKTLENAYAALEKATLSEEKAKLLEIAEREKSIKAGHDVNHATHEWVAAYDNFDASRQILTNAQQTLTDAQKTYDNADAAVGAAQTVVDLVPQVNAGRSALALAEKEQSDAAAKFKAYADKKRPDSEVAHTQNKLEPTFAYNLSDFGPALDGTDGKIGPETIKAILAYQADHGLAQNGLIDHQTRTSLNEDIQQALVDLGHLKGDGKTNPIDGKIGHITKQAVIDFQNEHLGEGLKPTGKLDHDTLQLLAKAESDWLDKNPDIKSARDAALQKRVAGVKSEFADPAHLLNAVEYDATITGIQTGTGIKFAANADVPGEARAYLSAEQRKNLTAFIKANPDMAKEIFNGRESIKGSDLIISTKGLSQDELTKFYDNRVVIQHALSGDLEGAAKAFTLMHDKDPTQSMLPYEAAITLHKDQAIAVESLAVTQKALADAIGDVKAEKAALAKDGHAAHLTPAILKQAEIVTLSRELRAALGKDDDTRAPNAENVAADLIAFQGKNSIAQTGTLDQATLSALEASNGGTSIADAVKAIIENTTGKHGAIDVKGLMTADFTPPKVANEIEKSARTGH